MMKLYIFIKKYFNNIIISFDQFINSVMAGDRDETISGRAGRVFFGTSWEMFINFIMMDKNHCKKSIERDEGKYDLIFPKKD